MHATASPTATRWPRRRAEAGIRVAPDDGWADIFSRVLVEKIEPHLGIGRATVLMEYPRAEAALARAKPGDAARRGAVRGLSPAASSSPTPSAS